jgi:hypothetical protein
VLLRREEDMTKWRADQIDRPIRASRRRGDNANLAFMRALAVSLIIVGLWTMWLAARTS